MQLSFNVIGAGFPPECIANLNNSWENGGATLAAHDGLMQHMARQRRVQCVKDPLPQSFVIRVGQLRVGA